MDYKNPLKMIDPLTGMEMTMQPPMPANQMGVAKPVFNPQVQGMAQTIYGTPEQRQMSMGQQAPVFMKDVPEGSEGAGLRKLPNNVVEKMGYDAATKMVSPLNSHHPQYFTGGTEVTKKEFDSINKAKKAKTYLGGGQGLIPDALTGGKPTRQFFNESTFFNPKTASERMSDSMDTRMHSYSLDEAIKADKQDKKPSPGTQRALEYYSAEDKKTRPNRKDRY